MLLITHPENHKNLNIETKFQDFAKDQKMNKAFLYNGLNEAPTFKTPGKLPTVVYFKEGKQHQVDRFKLMGSLIDKDPSKLDKLLLDLMKNK